jgi:hypothetical protein
MAEHTEGPWQIEKGGERLIHTKALVVSAPDDLGPVAFVTAVNAPLVAAAPDLFLACELIEGWIKHEGIAVGPVVWAELQRALAKARGEK